MSLAAQLARLLRPELERRRHLAVALATTAEDVLATQRLRYRVFVEEMGARLDCAMMGVERDRFDPYCQHLIVRDLHENRVVGCYRILTDTQARAAGGFYSQTEFDLAPVLARPGRFMEVGRTCVHPDYRNGATIALLWSGLARYMLMNRFDYLMGCASIPLVGGTEGAAAVYARLAEKHLSEPDCRAVPRHPLPRLQLADAAPHTEVPALIQAYLRVGARICGEPAWDPAFNVADLFLLLRADDISARYARHFVARG